MLKPDTITYRMPVYRGIVHFLSAVLRMWMHKLFQLGMRDCMNRKLEPGDRVFDPYGHYLGTATGQRSFHGTIITDGHSFSGLSIQWDDHQVSMLFTGSSLVKTNL